MSEKTTSRDHRLALGLCILLVLLLVGGTIGAWVYGARRQRAAVEVLTNPVKVTILLPLASSVVDSTHGDVRYDYELDDDFNPNGADPPGPAWLRDWLGLDYLAAVRGARIFQLDDQSLAALIELSGLASLQINDAGNPTDAVMAMLPRSPALEKLVLEGVPVTDDQLEVLPSCPHLRILEIDNCASITDAGLEPITRTAGLKSLSLSGENHLTDAALARLSALKHLEILKLDFKSGPSDGVLEQLQSLQRLRVLSIDLDPAGGLKYLDGFASLEVLICGGLTDESLASAARLTKLKHLTLSDCPQVSAAGLKNLEKFPNLESLSLWKIPGLDDGVLAQLAGMPNLQELIIEGPTTPLSDASLEVLGGASHLRRLRLHWCRDLTDQGLAQLAKLKSLDRLHILTSDPGQFSPTAISDLQKSLPRCEIDCEDPPR